jgi:hypothetical protein
MKIQFDLYSDCRIKFKRAELDRSWENGDLKIIDGHIGTPGLTSDPEPVVTFASCW